MFIEFLFLTMRHTHKILCIACLCGMFPHVSSTRLSFLHVHTFDCPVSSRYYHTETNTHTYTFIHKHKHAHTQFDPLQILYYIFNTSCVRLICPSVRYAGVDPLTGLIEAVSDPRKDGRPMGL